MVLINMISTFKQNKMKLKLVILSVCMVLMVSISVNAETQYSPPNLQNLSPDEAKTISEEFVKSKGISLEGYVMTDVEKICSYIDNRGTQGHGAVYHELCYYSNKLNKIICIYHIFNGTETTTRVNYTDAMNDVVECQGHVMWNIEWAHYIKKWGEMTFDWVGGYYPTVVVTISEDKNGISGSVFEPLFLTSGPSITRHDLSSTPPEKLREVMNKAVSQPIYMSIDPVKALLIIVIILITIISIIIIIDRKYEKDNTKQFKRVENSKRAGFGIRLASYLIDTSAAAPIAYAIGVIFAIYTKQDEFAGGLTFTLLFTTLIFIIYVILAEGKYGHTIGKYLLDLKVVTEDNQKIGYSKAFIRRISFMIPFLGIIDSLFIFRKNKQRMFDQIAKTIVTKKRIKKMKTNKLIIIPIIFSLLLISNAYAEIEGNTGEAVTISISASYPEKINKVNANITKPDGNWEVLNLYHKGDGNYENDFPNTDLEGTYYVATIVEYKSGDIIKINSSFIIKIEPVVRTAPFIMGIILENSTVTAANVNYTYTIRKNGTIEFIDVDNPKNAELQMLVPGGKINGTGVGGSVMVTSRGTYVNGTLVEGVNPNRAIEDMTKQTEDQNRAKKIHDDFSDDDLIDYAEEDSTKISKGNEIEQICVYVPKKIKKGANYEIKVTDKKGNPVEEVYLKIFSSNGEIMLETDENGIIRQNSKETGGIFNIVTEGYAITCGNTQMIVENKSYLFLIPLMLIPLLLFLLIWKKRKNQRRSDECL